MTARSQFTLRSAEQEYKKGRLFKALVLALIGIGWMLDDLTCFFPDLYVNFTEVDICEPELQKSSSSNMPKPRKTREATGKQEGTEIQGTHP